MTPPADDTRLALLDAASDLLGAEGADALTVRRIAERAGCSTMGVYTHFGGKEGVVDALFVDGFERLIEAMSRVRTTNDPLADLRRCCRTYREFALSNATQYRIMFDRSVPGYVPSEQSLVVAKRSLEALEQRVQRCLDAGVISPRKGDAESIAYGLWATAHGLVSLQLNGVGPPRDDEKRYRATTDIVFAGLTAHTT